MGTPNGWNGEDFTGRFGIGRWTRVDGGREVLLVSRYGSLIWSVTIVDSAPESIFDVAMSEALRGAGVQSSFERAESDDADRELDEGEARAQARADRPGDDNAEVVWEIDE